MKIKPVNRSKVNKRRAAAKAYFHYWLAPEKVKKLGRLSSRNKHNRRMKKLYQGSELQVLLRQQALNEA